MSENQKDGSDKCPLSKLPYGPMEEIAWVLAFGDEKYARGNWRNGTEWLRYSDAALRHIFAWLERQEGDEESGRSHLAHAAACLIFLMYYEQNGVGDDNRL